MLKAFKAQLRQLSYQNSEELVRDVRSRLGSAYQEKHLESVKSLVLVMPDLIQQIQIWANDSRVPKEDKKLHGYLLTYLFHPVDFLPDSQGHVFGYTDDAYLVGSVFVRTAQHIGSAGDKNHLQGLAKDVYQWMDVVREVIPAESQKIDRLLGDLIEGRESQFQAVFEQS